MRGHVRHRGEERAGSWEYIVDVGLAAAHVPVVAWAERNRPVLVGG